MNGSAGVVGSHKLREAHLQLFSLGGRPVSARGETLLLQNFRRLVVRLVI